MSEFTILIQGPVNKISLEGIGNYEKYGEVVVTTWLPTSDHKELIETMIPKHIRTNFQPLPSVEELAPGFLDPGSTFYYAMCSIMHGLDLVETEYVIKTRSDEKYLKLEPFIEGNIFFNPNSLHIGDHIFAAKTSTLRKAYGTLKDVFENGPPGYDWAKQGPNDAESIQAHAWLYSQGVEQDELSSMHAFEDNFDILCLKETEEFIARWHHAGAEYTQDNWDRETHRTTGPNKVSPSCKCAQCANKDTSQR